MSTGADSGDRLPAEWSRLERAAEEAALALGRWTRRSTETEEELDRLRLSIEALTAERSGIDELNAEIRRLQAENTAMERRMLQARKHISGLMQRLAALEIEP